MCAIAGIFHIETAKPVDPGRVRAMTDAQAHRGPDGSGVWTAQGVSLGHRRLAIIDLTSGQQPMQSDDGRIVVTFNGEIYNHLELRGELTAHGAQFRTGSDTEVLIHGWKLWGADMLDRLNGMFAFALYDDSRKCLLLARDRLGVKPLHYARLTDGSVAFASELKGLLANPAVRRELHAPAVDDYFAYGYVPDDTCLVAGVDKLPAGSFLLLQRGATVGKPVRWWDVDFSQQRTAPREALVAEMQDRLQAAVASRMIADVPVGAFLSGGVDSSTVVALMSRVSARPVQTCAIGFDESAFDETRFAERIARQFGTEHRERIVAPNDFSAIDTLADAFDEPFADASALPTFRVCQLARETVTVALSGDGADEIFAGYRRYKFQVAEARARAVFPEAFRTRVFGAFAAAYPNADRAPQFLRGKATLAALASSEGEAYARAVGVTPPEMRTRLFSDDFRRMLQGHRAEDRYIAAMRDAPASCALDRAQYADIKIWLPGDILTKVDRTSMAVSLEVREPLLDHRLVEFAARLSPAMRLRAGTGKWLMKKAMRGTLPDEILYRRKMGFVTPIGHWFRGPLLGEAQRVASRLGQTGYFAGTVLDSIVEAHRRGTRDHGRLLWQLVMFEKSLARLFGQ